MLTRSTVCSTVRPTRLTISSPLAVRMAVVGVAAGSVAAASLGSLTTLRLGYSLDLGGIRNKLDSSGCRDGRGGTQSHYRDKSHSCPAQAQLAYRIFGCHLRQTPPELLEFDWISEHLHHTE